MKKILCLLVIATISINSFAQVSNRTLLTVGDEQVSVDDFLSIYNKNRIVGEELDPKTLDEYVQLFVNFKLKVKEAEALGMDTVPSFIKELAGYRKQLATPYLVDNEAGEKLVLEAYERLKTEVKASHILISVVEDAGVKAINVFTSIPYGSIMLFTLDIKSSAGLSGKILQSISAHAREGTTLILLEAPNLVIEHVSLVSE